MQPNVMMGEMAGAPNDAATMMNPAGYMNFMNPATYGAWMNPAAYSGATAQPSNTVGQNWFDMSAWTNMFQPVPQVTTPKDEG